MLKSKSAKKRRQAQDSQLAARPSEMLQIGFVGGVIGIPLAGMVPMTWDEDRTTSRRVLYLRADTYAVDPLFDVPPARAEDTPGNYVVSPQGTFGYCNRILPKGKGLILDYENPSFVGFDGDVALPTLIDMKVERRLAHSVSADHRATTGRIWMSQTPFEMLTQRSGIQTAKGTVVVGGLGLGWFLRKVCERSSVERVIVVERSQELLDWYGTALCRKYPKVTDVICDDVYRQIGKHDEARYLLDIWPTYGEAQSDRRFIQAKRRLKKNIWGWGA